MLNILIIFSLITTIVSTPNDYMQQTANNYEYEEPINQYIPYGFGYEIADEFGNKNWRKEESQGESQVVGSYGFLDANGITREVEYIANKDGFRAQIKTNEPGTASNKNPADVSLDASPIPAPEQKNYVINQRISQLHNQRSESIHFPIYRQYLASV